MPDTRCNRPRHSFTNNKFPENKKYGRHKIQNLLLNELMNEVITLTSQFILLNITLSVIHITCNNKFITIMLEWKN